MLPQPTFTVKFEENTTGSKNRVEAALGVILTHAWVVEGISDTQCNVTEKVTVEAPYGVSHALKLALPSIQEKEHKNLQSYMS